MSVRFPPWVDAQPNDDERASARLRYLVNRAALEATGKQSVRALAEKIEMDHSSISNAIRRGYMSEGMAMAIEQSVGRAVLKANYLINPLKIKATA